MENKLQASEQVIAQVINNHPLTPEQADQAYNCGARASKNNLSAFENAETFARLLGDNPTYDHFESLRIRWVTGYLEDRTSNTPDSADKAFNTFKNQLNELFGINVVKPKSDNPVAQKKAEQRAKKKAELLSDYEDTSVHEIKDELQACYNTLAKNPSDKTVKKHVNTLEKIIKLKTEDQVKAENAEIKEYKAEIAALLKDCHSVDILASVIELLSQ